LVKSVSSRKKFGQVSNSLQTHAWVKKKSRAPSGSLLEVKEEEKKKKNKGL
jgi:hypothetical protein